MSFYIVILVMMIMNIIVSVIDKVDVYFKEFEINYYKNQLFNYGVEKYD